MKNTTVAGHFKTFAGLMEFVRDVQSPGCRAMGVDEDVEVEVENRVRVGGNEGNWMGRNEGAAGRAPLAGACRPPGCRWCDVEWCTHCLVLLPMGLRVFEQGACCPSCGVYSDSIEEVPAEAFSLVNRPCPPWHRHGCGCRRRPAFMSRPSSWVPAKSKSFARWLERLRSEYPSPYRTSAEWDEHNARTWGVRRSDGGAA